MMQISDHLTRSTPPSDSGIDSRPDSWGDRHERTELPQPDLARGLSDRQAVIAAMITTGVTCQDIAVDLMLPLRIVKDHLHQALRVLGVSRVQDLTYELITAHYDTDSSAATTRSDQRAAPEPARPKSSTNPTTGGCSLNSLVALDEAEASQAHDEELTHVAALTRELTAIRAQLDQERDTVQQLHKAVGSRDTIGQAKGILMERYKISADAAFLMLCDESSLSHRKLVNVAHNLIYSGEASASTT